MDMTNETTTHAEGTAQTEQQGAEAGVIDGQAENNPAAVISDLQAQVEALQTENSVLTAERDALQAKLTAADMAPKAQAAKAPNSRKIGPIAPPKNDEGDDMTTLELRDLVRSSGTVEVAFSDGKRELADVPARLISGDAWAVTVAGLALRGIDIEINGLPRSASIAGYGLLLDGKLAVYRERHEPLVIAPGTRVSLAGDIVF